MTTLLPPFRRALFGLSAACALLCVLTLAVPDWLEMFGFEPDGGDGTVEVLLAVGFGLGTLAFAAAAVVSARRARHAVPLRVSRYTRSRSRP